MTTRIQEAGEQEACHGKILTFQEVKQGTVKSKCVYCDPWRSHFKKCPKRYNELKKPKLYQNGILKNVQIIWKLV